MSEALSEEREGFSSCSLLTQLMMAKWTVFSLAWGQSWLFLDSVMSEIGLFSRFIACV